MKKKKKQGKVDEDEMFEMISKHLHGLKSLELIILKGHLLVEYALSRYIDVLSQHKNTIDELRFTFTQKLEILKILGFISMSDEWDLELLEQLKTLNKIRNEIAHSLTFDRKMLDQLFKYHPKELEEYKRYKEGNRDREILIGIIPWIFGALEYLMERKEPHEEALKKLQDINADMRASIKHMDELWKSALIDP
jgi:hypothetical protein